MHKLSVPFIARRNIQRKPVRSFCLIAAVLLLSLFVFAGSVMSLSLSKGAESTANRLGADVMLVPEGFDPHVDSVLLSGKPSTFYLPSGTLERLSGLEDDIGISQASPQTFLATLRASCCSYPVQLVGLDYDSDFIIRTWLESSLYHSLRDNEAIVGYHVSGMPGDKIQFFGRDITIAGRLEQTGMGFDSMVFMNRNTIALLAKDAERIIERPLNNDGSLDSVIMIKLKPGYDSSRAARELNARLNSQGVYALFSKKFVNTISRSLMIISRIINGSIIAAWILAVVIVSLVFSLTLSERKREFGVLRALGASRRKLIALCLTEALMISSYGAILGVFLGALAVIIAGPLASTSLGLPFLLPSWPSMIGFSLASFVIAILTGTFSALWSAVRASRADVHEIMRWA